MKANLGRQRQLLPPTHASRLTFKRLRSPTRMPSVVQTTSLGRYLDRLKWLFSGFGG